TGADPAATRPSDHIGLQRSRGATHRRCEHGEIRASAGHLRCRFDRTRFEIRHNFAGTVSPGERLWFHFVAPDADDFAWVDPVRILYDVGVAAKDLRPAERILEIEIRQVPERVALLHHVLD